MEDLYHGRVHNVEVSPPSFGYSRYDHLSREKKVVDVQIPKGAINGQTIRLSGLNDADKDSPPGDLLFVLNQAPHPTFTRKGNDLAMELTISLEEAICGVKRPIEHLDSTELWIESAKASRSVPLMIRTGDVQVLKGRGMPKGRRFDGDYGNSHSNENYGDLYVQYRVEMPRSTKNTAGLTKDEYKELSRLLSKLDNGSEKSFKIRTERKSDTENKSKIHVLKEAKSTDFGRASGKVAWDTDENDDEGHFHQDKKDNGDGFFPFGSPFSSAFGQSSSQQFYFGNNPFGHSGGRNHDDDGNVQCQQM